jgi:hypothetical protein
VNFGINPPKVPVQELVDSVLVTLVPITISNDRPESRALFAEEGLPRLAAMALSLDLSHRDAQEQLPQDPFISPTLRTRLGFVSPPTIPWR